MSTFNTTYNFEYPKQSFGQAILQGAMQSLGLGGCCGFGGGSFGMNSIFGGYSGFGTLGTFGGCMGGTVDYDAQAGYAVAGAVGNVLCQMLGSRQAAKAAEKPAEDRIKDIDTKISNLETKLESPEKQIDKKYDTAITNAEKSAETWSQDKVTSLEARKNELEEKGDNATETEKKELARLNGTGSGSIQEAKTNYDKYQKELEEAHNAKNKAIEDKKTELQDSINELKEEKAALEKQINDDVLDKGDGNKWQRLSQEKYQNLFNNGNLKSDAKVGKNAVRYAILGYRNALESGDTNAQAKYKKEFNALWDRLSESDKDDKNLKGAYDIINKK